MCGIYGVLSYKDKLKDMNELVDCSAWKVQNVAQTQPVLHIQF